MSEILGTPEWRAQLDLQDEIWITPGWWANVAQLDLPGAGLWQVEALAELSLDPDGIRALQLSLGGERVVAWICMAAEQTRSTVLRVMCWIPTLHPTQLQIQLGHTAAVSLKLVDLRRSIRRVEQ